MVKVDTNPQGEEKPEHALSCRAQLTEPWGQRWLVSCLIPACSGSVWGQLRLDCSVTNSPLAAEGFTANFAISESGAELEKPHPPSWSALDSEEEVSNYPKEKWPPLQKSTLPVTAGLGTGSKGLPLRRAFVVENEVGRGG